MLLAINNDCSPKDTPSHTTPDTSEHQVIQCICYTGATLGRLQCMHSVHCQCMSSVYTDWHGHWLGEYRGLLTFFLIFARFDNVDRQLSSISNQLDDISDQIDWVSVKQTYNRLVRKISICSNKLVELGNSRSKEAKRQEIIRSCRLNDNESGERLKLLLTGKAGIKLFRVNAEIRDVWVTSDLWYQCKSGEKNHNEEG